ncbi:hypothetical protein [Malaciobacter marinus]|uniref:Uncharacterized protein n=1 Tax=Malaciobacter marinus TaxID=505249 RepID=A0A347TI82_9BACT|nr:MULTISPECIES: hypothetical protein [Malaciobacter]AXX86310.1 hypothetical protein AMRN_0542 [Malaciobacter marinus]PHO15437.1 hypothetical protein CPH92_06895 [Malaciobacter marinus]RYA23508.1 hypothetical protein CRU96_07490 [Malaciobacter halophilus]
MEEKQEQEELEVLVVLELKGLQNQDIFEKHVTKEGFKIVEGEKFAYSGKSTTGTFSTKAYILEIFRKGLSKVEFETCGMIFQIGDMPWQAYKFDKTTNEFNEVK